MAKRKSIFPWHPTGGGVPPSGMGMSSLGPLVPLLLVDPLDEEVDEVESFSAPLEEELLLPELLELPGNVVTPGSVGFWKPLPGEFPHAPSARDSTSGMLRVTEGSLHHPATRREPGRTWRAWRS